MKKKFLARMMSTALIGCELFGSIAFADEADLPKFILDEVNVTALGYK